MLKKGMNFAVTPEWIPVDDIIVGVEGGLQGYTGSDVDKAHLKIAGVKPPPSNLPWSLRRALDDLKKTEDIVILPADKGRCTVVMDETEYHARVDSLFAYQKFYKVLDKDPTSSTQRKMNAALLGLKKNDTIPEPLYHRLRSSGGHIPLLYGLLKVHSLVSPQTHCLIRVITDVRTPSTSTVTTGG